MKRRQANSALVGIVVSLVFSFLLVQLGLAPIASASTLKMIFPATGNVSSVNGPTGKCQSKTPHDGYDIANSNGGSILAASAGSVIFSGTGSGSFGQMIKIKHDAGGYETWYAHLASRAVSTGNHVVRGQTIGQMGGTGKTPPWPTHLHFEIRRNGGLVNANSAITCGSSVTRGTVIPFTFLDGIDTVGVARDVGDFEWYLRSTNASTGTTAFKYKYGLDTLGDVPVAGDWDGDGIDTAGVARPLANGEWEWWLRNNNTTTGATAYRFNYGMHTLGDVPVAGDWNGDGTDTPGVARPISTGDFEWYLRSDNSASGTTAFKFKYGVWTQDWNDHPVAGDWNGDSIHTPGVARPLSTGDYDWYLRSNNSSTGTTAYHYKYGKHTLLDVPVAGDWDGNGTETAGVSRPLGTDLDWYLRSNNTSTGTTAYHYKYGVLGDREVAGDWNGG